MHSPVDIFSCEEPGVRGDIDHGYSQSVNGWPGLKAICLKALVYKWPHLRPWA